MVGPRLPGWNVVIGIETHIKLATKHKLFSNGLTSFSFTRANERVHAFDAAIPGTLPKLNQEAVTLAIRTALALKCEIANRSTFDRKHYFYHDLPSGYQITQHYSPIARSGILQLEGRELPVNIKQIQLEQDTAKTTTIPSTGISQIDLNRAGQGLLEIVTEPDFRSSDEAASYVRLLQSVVRAVGASDGNMEQGSLRVDVNVSINPDSAPRGSGTRCEIKNLNSVKSVAGAIEYEIKRQHALLTSIPPKPVQQLTLTYNVASGQTVPLRSKEDAPDYRYMPDPNIGTVFVSNERIQEVAGTMPELPWETRERLEKVYNLTSRDVHVLMDIDVEAGGGMIGFFEALCLPPERDSKLVFNWFTNTLWRYISDERNVEKRNPFNAKSFGQVIDMVQSKQLTITSAQFLIRHVFMNLSSFTSLTDARTLAATLGMIDTLTSSPSNLEAVCLRVIQKMPSEAKALKDGTNPNVVNRLVGGVMKEMKGKASPDEVKILLKELVERS
ncbi:GatB/GatE catalytic domain-containing protein [Flagelloscypha sp. PMI_526]|nr:GatB/GatE catalytic domain-containing protein [Flagelloscypha sp. PMI_526]